jgi:hypothetical protein
MQLLLGAKKWQLGSDLSVDAPYLAFPKSILLSEGDDFVFLCKF